ncbi:glycosyltransferase family 4 protein [Woodsholea maritima]|uniref:glycosyltransferase family 4 protein n=1 Tax=Woodsholea maritima TaxID=240237 RepID=UPI0003605B59|nr:glycosyltransferase family 4 protein [Woodsholea maritima]
MNILQVIPELDAGGAERTTLEVAEIIIRSGGKALVVSQGGRMVDELKALGAELIRMPVKSKNPFTIWQNAGRLTDIIRKRDIDIIHARSRAPAWSAYWAAKRTLIPFVTTYHGTYNAKSGFKRWYNSVMAKGDRVIANSNFIADHVRREHGVGEDRLRIIPRGVDLKTLDPKAVNHSRIAAMRASWDLAPEQKAILLPARLTRWKGQEVALKAFAPLAPKGYVLVMAGDAQGRDDYVDGLRSLAKDLGILDNIRLPGHILDMPAAYVACEVVLTPSIEPEAFGRTAAEAQAMGRAVIAADHGGACEVIADQKTGWRVTPGDDQALAQTLSHVLSLPQDRLDQLAMDARARVVEHFSKQSLQEKTLQVYREALEYDV